MSLIRPIERVTILGLGPSIYDWILAVHDKFGADDGEVWTINAGAKLFRHDLLFDMHSPGWIAKLDERKDVVTRRREWLKGHDKPIVMPRKLPEFPTSVAYPLAEIQEKTRSSYFAVGVCYPLALAYVCDVRHLSIYGVDFFDDQDERGRPCAEYWIGRLVEKGCQVVTSDRAHFMSGKLYGY